MNRDTDASRRRFLAIAAVASAVAAGSMAVAATPTTAHQCFAADDSELLRLEKEISAAREAAQAYDPEMIRLSELPASEELERLTTLQQPHWTRHDEAVERMFAIPAQTAEGRGAKASVVLGLMAAFMASIDEDEDYPLGYVRSLLTELVGGAPVEA
jgi:hypothetical protein